MKKIALLGSTGSIGTQTLDVVKKHANKYKVVALSAYSNATLLAAQASEFKVSKCVLSKDIQNADFPDGCNLEYGDNSILDLVKLEEADIVVNALVGAAGLRVSYETLKAGKILALANKESLVVAGEIIMALARKNESEREDDLLNYPNLSSSLLPIDSEHGAIFQCLIGENHKDVQKLWVTASGGPFRGKSVDELKSVTAKEALAHPTWKMGPKITIDSSTLMNKGLEVIEAHHLFDIDYDRIKVVVQPQSAIHSMVEFVDGSVKAHLGTTDMRIPIQYALSYPERLSSPVEPVDFTKIGSLDFEAPDIKTFKALSLAYEAGKAGGTMPCVMNAANEVAVAAFLEEKIAYLDIANCVEKVMSLHERQSQESIEQLLEVDAWARQQACKCF